MASASLLPRGGAARPSARSNRPSTRRMFSLLVFLTIACGCIALLALDPKLLAPGAGSSGQQRFITGGADAGPTPLAFPLWWHAPVFSESGALGAAE